MGFCSKCGQRLADDVAFCPACGAEVGNNGTTATPNYSQPQPQPELPPSNNLVWAILTTVLCCLPFGIVAIYYACKVDGFWFAGYKDEARRYADKAKTWSIVSAIIGVVIVTVYIIFVVYAASKGILRHTSGSELFFP